MIGDPATVMVFTDSAKATSGFDLGLEKAMASDLDGLRWRPLFKSQSWTLWVHDSIDAIWAISVDEFAPIYSWVSSAYWWKDTIPLLFWVSGMSPITSTTGEINKTKRRGPRTEPCGTPVSEVSQEEDDESILTKDERFVKYEWIQVWTVPDKPNVCSSLWRRVVWSRVSKAADISRAARIVTFPESMASKISLVNLSKAVSVEWNFRYADWRGEKLGEMERWGRRRAKAKRSNILPIVFKLEIGLKFEGSDLESPGFFRRGVMRACLNFDGKAAWSNDRLARWDMRIEKVLAHDLSKDVET